MSARIRKLIGSVAILAFLLLYTGAAVAVADHLPSQWAIKLVFFVIVGTAWGAPLIPLITWMNRGK